MALHATKMSEDSFHHRSVFKQSKKPFKGRSSGRRQRSASGKQQKDKLNLRNIDANHTKEQRLNKNKQLQKVKRQEAHTKARIGSRQGPPRIVALVALHDSVNLQCLQASLAAFAESSALPSKQQAMAVDGLEDATLSSFSPHASSISVSLLVDKRPQKFTFISTPRESMAVLDAAKVADIVLFVGSVCDTASPSATSVAAIDAKQNSADIDEDMSADMHSQHPGSLSNYVPSSFDVCDALGRHFLSIIKAQGLPSSVGIIQHLKAVPAKHQIACKRQYHQFFEDMLPDDPKVFAVDSVEDCGQLYRWIANLKLKEIHWRDFRSYLLASSVAFFPSTSASSAISSSSSSSSSLATGTLLVSGHLRGNRPLSVNQLVHVTGFGDYQLSQIDGFVSDRDAASIPGVPIKHQPSALGPHLTVLQTPDVNLQESLESLIPVDPLATTGQDQSIITDEEIKDAENARVFKPHKQDIQSIWNEAVPEGNEENEMADGDLEEDLDRKLNSDSKDDDALPTDAALDGDRDEFVSKKDKSKPLTPLEAKRALEADEMKWPDEVDTPRHLPAKVRFAKYRGLKSFKHSKWDKFENLPVEYHRIYTFERFAQTRKRVMALSKIAPIAQETISSKEKMDFTPSFASESSSSMPTASSESKTLDVEMMNNPSHSLSSDRYGQGVESGTNVVLHLSNVPVTVAQQIIALFSQSSAGRAAAPLVLWGLLEFEHKVSVLHFSVHRHAEDEDIPIKGKEPMLFNYGFRRFVARPIYSQNTPGADKFLVERFFCKDRWSVASVYGRIMFPPAPVLMFRNPMTTPSSFSLDISSSSSSSSSSLVFNSFSACAGIPIAPGISIERAFNPLAASGTVLSVDPHRLLIKRVVLTGYPTWCARRSAVVRFMFFNPDDVRWFKPVEIRTKLGCVGVIHEPRGTKGYMKCSFDQFIKQNDVVCMQLYKRQFPPWQSEDVF